MIDTMNSIQFKSQWKNKRSHAKKKNNNAKKKNIPTKNVCLKCSGFLYAQEITGLNTRGGWEKGKKKIEKKKSVQQSSIFGWKKSCVKFSHLFGIASNWRTNNGEHEYAKWISVLICILTTMMRPEAHIFLYRFDSCSLALNRYHHSTIWVNAISIASKHLLLRSTNSFFYKRQ